MRKFLVAFAPVLLSVCFSSIAKGQNKASAEEVIAKVREAAGALSKTRDLAQFDRKQGPWVWRDGYIFVIDCNKQTVVAHPVTPQLIGRSLGSIRDTKGIHLSPIRPAIAGLPGDLPASGSNTIGRSLEK